MPAMQGPPPGTLGPPPFRGPPSRGPPSGFYGPPPSAIYGPPMAPPGTLPHPSLMRSGVLPPGAPPMHVELPAPPAPGGPPIQAPAPPGKPGNVMGTHVPLAKCRVLYIGSAVPTETSVGLEAVQQPLNDRYTSDGVSATSVLGIDAWLTVFSSGILMQYTKERANITWFPIHTLHVSAAVKCVRHINNFTGQNNCKFVSLDSPSAKSSSHPPVFGAIMRRTSGVKVLECHSFICKSDQQALALVQSTTHAYEHKEGWAEEIPPKELHQELEGTINTADPNSEPDLPLFQPSDKESIDKPPIKGHFYNAKPELVKSFNVHSPQAKTANLMSHVVPPPAAIPYPRPLPMVPDRAYSNPYLLPTKAPPSGYFEDWDAFQGQPVMVFPGPYMSEEEYKKTVREVRSRRKPRTKDRRRDRTYDRPPPRNIPDRKFEPVYDRHLPGTMEPPRRHYDPPPPRRHDYPPPPSRHDYPPPPSRHDHPPSDYMDDFGNRYYKGPPEPEYGYREELPRAIERREYVERHDPDMVLYAPRYMNHIDPDPRDFGRDHGRASPGPRYPRNEREFSQSMAEERRLVGDMDRPDPYRMNDHRGRDDIEMFRDGGYGDLTRDLGYLP